MSCGGRILQKSGPGELNCVLKEIIMAAAKQVLSKVEANEHFVLVWQGEECLWNVMCNNYHNRDERAETKKHIAEKLEIRVSDVETKMNSLRTYYFKELAKVRKSSVERSGMGTDELVPPSKWPHFQSIEFFEIPLLQEKQYRP